MQWGEDEQEPGSQLKERALPGAELLPTPLAKESCVVLWLPW
jgi:hypothetical protein